MKLLTTDLIQDFDLVCFRNRQEWSNDLCLRFQFSIFGWFSSDPQGNLKEDARNRTCRLPHLLQSLAPAPGAPIILQGPPGGPRLGTSQTWHELWSQQLVLPRVCSVKIHGDRGLRRLSRGSEWRKLNCGLRQSCSDNSSSGQKRPLVLFILPKTKRRDESKWKLQLQRPSSHGPKPSTASVCGR